jgi:amino acid transporter
MMFPGITPGRRNLPQHPAQRKLLLFWCWLYLSLGVTSAMLGILVLTSGSLFTGGRAVHPDAGIITIAVIMIVFGLLRIANSVYHIRRLSRMR